MKPNKFAHRAKKYIFLGHADRVKGYRFWCLDPKSLGIIIRRDITFDQYTILHAKRHIGVVREKDASPLVEVQVEAPV